MIVSIPTGGRPGASLRIVFANSIRMWGGAEVWMLGMMRALEERGHTTRLVCAPGTELEAEARRRGLAVHPLRMLWDLGPLAIARMAMLLRDSRSDVVCTNRERELRVAGVAARLAGGIPVVARRAIDHPLKNNLRYRWTYNSLATRVIANSEATKRNLLRNAPWLDPGRITVIHNGIDPAAYEGGDGARVRRQHRLDDRAPLIGFVGQLDSRKGIRYLLEAFLAVRCRFPGVHGGGQAGDHHQREQHAGDRARSRGRPARSEPGCPGAGRGDLPHPERRGCRRSDGSQGTRARAPRVHQGTYGGRDRGTVSKRDGALTDRFIPTPPDPA